MSDGKNMNRVCEGCRSGGNCGQPYESSDGTIYYCTRIEEANDEQ